MNEVTIRQHVEWINDDNVYVHFDLGMDGNEPCTAKIANEVFLCWYILMTRGNYLLDIFLLVASAEKKRAI